MWSKRTVDGSREPHHTTRQLSVGGTALAAAPTPYAAATVFAARNWDTDNTDVVRILVAGGTGGIALHPGQSYQLPDGCDLADFVGYGANADDGVLIEYTTTR